MLFRFSGSSVFRFLVFGSPSVGLTIACGSDEEADAISYAEPRGFEYDPPADAGQSPESEDVPDFTTRCGSAGPAAVDIVWSAAPSASDSVTLPTTVATATLLNQTVGTVSLREVRVGGDASGIPFLALIEPGPVHLASGESLEIDVDFGAHAELSSMASSGAITLFARAETLDGNVVEQSSSEPLYFHPVEGGMEVYGSEALESSKAAGDVFGAAAADLEPGENVRRVIIFPPSVPSADSKEKQ